MNADTLGVCAPNIVERHVQRQRMCIAKGAGGAFRVPGSVTYRYWPLYCSSRVQGNLHARFLGGWARATAPGYPPSALLSIAATDRRLSNAEVVIRDPPAAGVRTPHGIALSPRPPRPGSGHSGD